MKILAVPESKTIGEGKGAFIVHTIKCEYDNTKTGGTKFPLDVQVGANAVQRLVDKYPEGEYVGKRAYFTKGLYQGKNPQFINPIMKEFNEPINKDSLFAPKVDNTVEEPVKEEANPSDSLLFSSDDMDVKEMNFKPTQDELELLERIRTLDQTIVTEKKFVEDTVMPTLKIPKSRADALWKFYGNQ